MSLPSYTSLYVHTPLLIANVDLPDVLSIERIQLLQRLRLEDEERRKKEQQEKERKEKLEQEIRRKREAGE